MVKICNNIKWKVLVIEEDEWLFCCQVLSYFLLAGAAAALGSSVDLKANMDMLNSFFDQGNAAAALLLLAFLCSAIISVLSSLALSNKPNQFLFLGNLYNNPFSLFMKLFGCVIVMQNNQEFGVLYQFLCSWLAVDSFFCLVN